MAIKLYVQMVLSDDDSNKLLVRPVKCVGYGKASEVVAMFEDIQTYLDAKGLRPEATPRREPKIPMSARVKRILWGGMPV